MKPIERRFRESQLTRRELSLTPQVEAALKRGATIVVSISGGKDSLATLIRLAHERKERRWPGAIYALHCDLGRIEWQSHFEVSPEFRGTAEEVKRQCDELGVKLIIVHRNDKRDLIEHIEAQAPRTLARKAAPWPGPGLLRYCTSDLKTVPTNCWVNRRYEFNHTVIVAMGIRALESDARALRPIARLRPKCQARTKGREVFDWNPILKWTAADVWEEIGPGQAELKRRQALAAEGKVAEAIHDWPAHPAYALGNERLSCSLCVLGSPNDLMNGIRWNPDTADYLIGLERKWGYTFQNGCSLESLRDNVAENRILTAVEEVADIPCDPWEEEEEYATA